MTCNYFRFKTNKEKNTDIIASSNPQTPGIIISGNFFAVKTGATTPPANHITPKFARNSDKVRLWSSDNLISYPEVIIENTMCQQSSP